MNSSPFHPVKPPQTLASALRDAAAELQMQQPPLELLTRVKASAKGGVKAHVMAQESPPGVDGQPAGAAGAGVGGRRGVGRRLGERIGRWIVGWRARRAPVVAVATVLGATALLVVLRPPAPLLVPDEGVRYGGAAPGFVAVAPAERWPRNDMPAWLVSTELQRERLAALGLPYDPGRAGEAVRAELLLHPSGEVLAVRLLN